MGVTLIALLANYTIRTLMKCGERVMQINQKKQISDAEPHPPSYPEIGRAAMGEIGKLSKVGMGEGRREERGRRGCKSTKKKKNRYQIKN